MATATETQWATEKPEDLDWSARYASIVIREQLAEIQKGIRALPDPSGRNELAPIADTLYQGAAAAPESEGKTYKVGIIGAGAAGLFTGMIFDFLKETYGLKVEYEILEVNNPERLGGRLYSHYFKDVEDPDASAHNYYDVGAMRFPNSPIMTRVFSLFQNVLDMKKVKAGRAKPGALVPYILQGENTAELYNDIQVVNPKQSQSTADTFNVTGLPTWEAKQTPGSLISEAIDVFIKRLKRDKEAGWEYLMEKGDAHSVRQWFLNTLDYDTTEWLETYSYGTAWYDQALSEMVLESLTFDWDKDWWCIEGGAQEIAKRMFGEIEKTKPGRVSFGKKVTKLERPITVNEEEKKVPDLASIAVKIQGEDQARTYDAVFNSAPFGAMQRMDLRGLNLNWGTKQAIRSLGYGASCKVGIRFKYMWWIKDLNIVGGVSKTDLPIRMCVYPSYNVHDDADKPGVLLCSYSWSMEAQRMGTLINRESPSDEEELKALLLDNLAKLHISSPDQYDGMHKKISDAYETHFAYDWYTDPGTTGAFAYFGPGQFKNMYPYVVRNDGVHIIIGEASSSHHAWVVGALESAVRGVYQFLYKHSETDPTVNKVLQKYNDDKIPAPYGPLPAEFDRTRDVVPLGGSKKKEEGHVSAKGEWLRQGVLAETLRLDQGGERLDPKAVGKDQIKEFTRLAA